MSLADPLVGELEAELQEQIAVFSASSRAL
jgi:hypothetical protein